MHGMKHEMASTGTPAMPGQDAFGAIAEVVQMLDADPSTDWSKVDLERLRQHLIDMDEVTMRSMIVGWSEKTAELSIAATPAPAPDPLLPTPATGGAE